MFPYDPLSALAGDLASSRPSGTHFVWAERRIGQIARQECHRSAANFRSKAPWPCYSAKTEVIAGEAPYIIAIVSPKVPAVDPASIPLMRICDTLPPLTIMSVATESASWTAKCSRPAELVAGRRVGSRSESPADAGIA